MQGEVQTIHTYIVNRITYAYYDKFIEGNIFLENCHTLQQIIGSSTYTNMFTKQ